MDCTLRQVEQRELGRRDLHRLAFLPFDYTAHQVAMTYVRHWAVWALALAAFAGILACGWSALLALAGLAWVPAYAYAHSRTADWLVIQRAQPDYASFEAVWGLPHRVYVAECNRTKQLLAMVCLQHKSRDTCDLQHAAVRSAHRRNGLGSRLVNLAIAEATSLGYSRMTLYSTSVQSPAVSMYLRLGFTLDRVHQDGVHRRIPLLPKPFAYVHMSRRLGETE